MTIQLFTAITSFVISFLTIPVIIKYSLQKNIVDVPGRRKIHKRLTPSMGGIAIFLSFFIATLVGVEVMLWTQIKFIMVSLFVIFFIGVRDDLVPIRAMIKLVGQVLVAFIIIFLLDLRIHSLYGLFGVDQLPDSISYIITTLTIIAITNSFNLIDGLDGLAGTIASIALLAFGIWFFLVGEELFSILAFSMAGGVIAFLIFNWEPSEVFMGDTGALVIGMMLSILSVHFIEFNFHLPSNDPFKFDATITTAICFIIIPLVDTLRIIIIRISRKQSPFSPDKSHIHHALLRLGPNHSRVTIILGITHLFFIILAILFNNIPDKFLLPGLIVTCLLLSTLIDLLILKRLKNKETASSKSGRERQS